MSKNNLVLVVKKKCTAGSRWYVLKDINADTDWNVSFAFKKTKFHIYTRNEATALVLAHRIDKKLQSEYGVRTMTISCK